MKATISFDGFKVTELSVPTKQIRDCIAVLGWTVLNNAKAESKADEKEMKRMRELCEDIVIPENCSELIKAWTVATL